MDEVFDNVMNHLEEGTPKSVLILCENKGTTANLFKRYLEDRNIPFDSAFSYFQFGTLKVHIHYVRVSGRWFEFLRGLAFNYYYTTCKLTENQEFCVRTRIRN